MILTVISSRSDRAPIRRTVDARLGKGILIVPGELLATRQLYRDKHFLVHYRQKRFRFCDLVRDVDERIIANALTEVLRDSALLWMYSRLCGDYQIVISERRLSVFNCAPRERF